MVPSFDPRDDLADVADGLRPVTFFRPGSSIAVSVAHALCSRMRTGENRASEGRYTASDVTWHLPADELTEIPQPGDLIVDDEAQRWTLLGVVKTTLGSRWRCVCRNMAVAHGLDQYVHIDKASYAKGTGGAEEATWHTWKTGLRAKIQPTRSQVDDEPHRRGTDAVFKVFLVDDLDLDHTHRVRGPDGTTYRIVKCHKADRIDALMEIDVVRVE